MTYGSGFEIHIKIKLCIDGILLPAESQQVGERLRISVSHYSRTSPKDGYTSMLLESTLPINKIEGTK